ncbi:DNA sulfur modification protein DndE [Saccharothrix tamanrassetensis]|uniref:DNA sulfur modification protein DndE n=1 Tax=Saccharothrix tamanrassetensis TaxID=1051531 RepID=A0A841CKD5_9PSEU|nr:DNA sulfur modification protein DndE [Saccharothrix tamanrassetensis]
MKEIVTDSNVEMSWRTFAGQYGDIYLALLKQRCISDGEVPTDEVVSRTLIIHLHRGIGYLGGNKEMNSIEGMISSVSS